MEGCVSIIKNVQDTLFSLRGNRAGMYGFWRAILHGGGASWAPPCWVLLAGGRPLFLCLPPVGITL